MLFSGHEVLGHTIEYQNGCFTREKYWLCGWVRNLPNVSQVVFAQGWSGPETILTVESIRACQTFTVVEKT
jgi:hypothetical protein